MTDLTTDTALLADGQRLREGLAGRYTVVRLIGRGGMASVWLARDTRHDREVAIKLLQPDLGAMLGAERFLTEIRVTAGLQHPNCLPLFDSGAFDGLLWYAMPFVDGESLRDRMDREGALPIGDAVHITLAVARALEHAHSRGVVHRDLKPENILLQGGEPIVADFGLALAVSSAGGTRLTQSGMALGTPQYMSPEQATADKHVDARTDVWALGAICYEMLAGEAPHTGTTPQAVIARVVTEAPRPLSVVRPNVPVAVQQAVERALAKLPADRFTSAAEFARALTVQASTTSGPTHSPVARVSAKWRAVPWIVAGVATLGAGAAWLRPAPVSASDARSTVRVPFALTADDALGSAPGVTFSLARDGRGVAYVGERRGVRGLFYRRLDELVGRMIEGTQGRPLTPVLSPDGAHVAYLEELRLMRVPVGGGTPQYLATVPDAGPGLLWLHPDTLMVSDGDKLHAVPATGGALRTITVKDSAAQELGMYGFQPIDARGDQLVYTSVIDDGTQVRRIGLLDRRTGRKTITRHITTTMLGAVDNHVVWVMPSGLLHALPASSLTDSTASPVVVGDGVLVGGGGAAKAVATTTGGMVYVRGQSAATLTLQNLQTGARRALVEQRDAYGTPRYSPDGRFLAVTVRAADRSTIRVLALTGGAGTTLTIDGDVDYPEWTPDGRALLYKKRTRTGTILEMRNLDGTGTPMALTKPSDGAVEGVPTPDGRGVVFTAQRQGDKRRIFLRTIGDTASSPVTLSKIDQEYMSPRFSPDGRWLVLGSSTRSSRSLSLGLYAWPSMAEQLPLADTGLEPVWSADGRSIFYRANRSILAARLEFRGTPRVVRRDTVVVGVNAFLGTPLHATIDRSLDGRELLLVEYAPSDVQAVVVLGWADEVRSRLAPAAR
jgi:eukaryotic-like serine/threonine-protein kinase